MATIVILPAVMPNAKGSQSSTPGPASVAIAPVPRCACVSAARVTGPSRRCTNARTLAVADPRSHDSPSLPSTRPRRTTNPCPHKHISTIIYGHTNINTNTRAPKLACAHIPSHVFTHIHTYIPACTYTTILTHSRAFAISNYVAAAFLMRLTKTVYCSS